jgi:hypothetical protein
LEHPHRPTLEDHVHRATRLGSSRSLNLRIGISGCALVFKPNPLKIQRKVAPVSDGELVTGT